MTTEMWLMIRGFQNTDYIENIVGKGKIAHFYFLSIFVI